MGKPTIDDVAAAAGVARATVSRVLNDHPNVSKAARAKVEAAVEQLGYRVNQQARQLAGRTALRVALIHASDFDVEPNSYFSAAIELGATRAANAAGTQLMIHALDQGASDAAQRIEDAARDDLCDAVVLTPPFSDHLDLIAALQNSGRAVVCLAAAPGVEAHATTVGIDDRQAGYDIASYLIGQGHVRLAFLKGLATHISAERRFDGFLAAIHDAGHEVKLVACERGNFAFRSGHDRTAQMLAAGEPFSALVCANDDMAAGALQALHMARRAIPGDVAVTGFDDTPVSQIVWPPLTTIHQPLRDMGRIAVEWLHERAADPAMPPRAIVLPHRLIERESSAASGPLRDDPA